MSSFTPSGISSSASSHENTGRSLFSPAADTNLVTPFLIATIVTHALTLVVLIKRTAGTFVILGSHTFTTLLAAEVRASPSSGVDKDLTALVAPSGNAFVPSVERIVAFLSVVLKSSARVISSTSSESPPS